MRAVYSFFLVLAAEAIFEKTSWAFQAEVVARVGQTAVTNADVYERIKRKTSDLDRYLGTTGAENILKEIIHPILYELYLQENHIQISEQEVMEELDRIYKDSPFHSAQEAFRCLREPEDASIRDWAPFLSQRTQMLETKALLHYAPDISVVKEEDIRNYIETSKKERRRLPVFQFSERIQACVLKAEPNVLAEIQKQISSGQSFESAVKEYAGLKFDSSLSPELLDTLNLEKKGPEKTIPWSQLKGKIVLVSYRGADELFGVWVQDYKPKESVPFEEAVRSNREEIRERVYEHMKQEKYNSAKRRFLQEQWKEKVQLAVPEEKLYGRLAEQYLDWWKDTFRNAPDFEKRYKALLADKACREEEEKQRKELLKRNIVPAEKPSREELIEHLKKILENEPNNALNQQLKKRLQEGYSPQTKNLLEIVSLFPAGVTELPVGQRLSVEIYYRLGTVQRGQIWARPYRQGKPAGGYSAHPLISVEKAVAKEGIIEGWFSFSIPVQIDEIRVFLRDSDSQKTVKEISYPADFRWTK